MSTRPRRSVLYMPGSSARALEKARSLPCDALILDLEDAVAPEAKEQAREAVAAAIRAGGFGPRETIIRVNGSGTPWGAQDLIAAAKAGPDAVLVPKVSSAKDIMDAAHALEAAGAPAHTKLWIMMETPAAIIHANALGAIAAEPASRLTVLVMGTNDLAKETRARLVPGRIPMLAWLSSCLIAARAHGLDIIDGVFNDLGNEAAFRAECEQGRDMGMDGKTLIHPSQIAPCNEIFAPTRAELDWAAKIIAAFDLPENAAKGALQLEGRMVERLHADMAHRTLDIGRAIAEMENSSPPL